MRIKSRKKRNEIPFDQISKEIPYHFKLIRQVDYEFDGYLVEFTGTKGTSAHFMDLNEIPFGYYLWQGSHWILKAYPLERIDNNEADQESK